MSEYELKDIESLRDNEVREDHQIEYKAGESFKDTKEITRDVSSFANASGGIIIYGMTETKNPDEGAIPEEIIPIPLDKKANSEWLEHIINSIEPKIPNVRIYPILVTPGNFAYVVVVPKGDTAYQASDLKYYRRYNFQRLAMRDQEVRDVMNRTKHPRVI